MKIQLHINELGPIHDATISLGRFMLFTGMSSIGKSYTNFLCYYVFRVFANNRLHNFLNSKIEGKMVATDDFSISFTIADLRRWMHDDVKEFMAMLLNNKNINCDINFLFPSYEDADKFVFAVSQRDESVSSDSRFKWYQVSYKEQVRYAICIGELRASFISSRISYMLGEEFFEQQVDRAFLMPPGRSVLIDNTYTVQSAATNMGMYDIFLRDFDLIRHYRRDKEQQDDQFFKSRVKKLLHGELRQDKDGISITLPTGVSLPLSAVASSIRELSPILFWTLTQNIGSQAMCIEEPEAHAHPEMQFDIADLLVACVNKGSLLQVTTHSDYLLHRLNQLIRLYKIQQKNADYFSQLQAQYKISPRDLLNPDMVAAYYFYVKDEKVIVEKLDASDGVPFRSFESIVERQFRVDEYIEKGLEEG